MASDAGDTQGRLGEGTTAGTARTVLLVDDDVDTLRSYETLLRSGLENVHVLPASSGADAIRFMWTRRIHLVVTDLNMPGIDGVEVLAAARLIIPRVPRLLMTSAPVVPEMVHVDGLARLCIEKPGDPDEFVELTRRFLE